MQDRERGPGNRVGQRAEPARGRGLSRVRVQPGPQELDEQDVHDAVEDGRGSWLALAQLMAEQPQGGVQRVAGPGRRDVQHLRKQGEQRQRDRGILLVTGAEDPRLGQARPQLELAAKGLMLVRGQVFYRHGRRAGRADQDVIRAGGEQGDVAGHEVGVGAPGDAQPGRARGERVEGRARDVVQQQTPRLGGVDGARHRSAHAGHREDRGQGIHRFILRCAGWPSC